MSRLKDALIPAGLILLALTGALTVLATGPLGVTPDALLAAMVGAGPPEAELALALRGPRLLAALTCGAALAGAGAGFQILFRNPLAAPDLLGVSSGAGFGAAVALLLGAGGLAGAGVVDPLWIAAWLFVGAVAGNWISYAIGRRIGRRAYRIWPLNRNRRGVARARLFFRRYGFAAVFLSRFLGPLRATLPVVAGVMEMDPRRFHAANLLSGLFWVPAILGPGYLAADNLPEGGITQMHILLFVAGLLAITGLGAWLGARVMKGKR